MRLIDGDEVDELFYKQVEYGATDLMDAFDDALQDCQAVDAVPVVRCRDCANNVWGSCLDDPNGFCSLGKRKGGD